MSVLADRPGVDPHVEVWVSYTNSWTEGFAIEEVVGDAYRLRRLSDGAILPGAFEGDRVRRRGRPRALPAAG